LVVNPVGFVPDHYNSQLFTVKVFILSEGTKYYFFSTYTAEEEVQQTGEREQYL